MNNDLKDIALDKTPDFYESITDSPVREMIEGKFNVYDNLLRTEFVIPVSVNVTETVDLGGGFFTYGSGSTTVQHGITNGEVFIDLVTNNVPFLSVPFSVDVTFDSREVTVSIDMTGAIDAVPAFTASYVLVVYHLLTKE